MKDNPPSRIKPNGYIINLQDTLNSEGEQNGGTHWVALWFSKKRGGDRLEYIVYFDSFGFAIPQSLINWIRTKVGIYKNSKIVSNDKNIQDVDTGGCGIYSLFFIQFMNANKHLTSLQGLEKFKETSEKELLVSDLGSNVSTNMYSNRLYLQVTDLSQEIKFSHKVTGLSMV
jgi:hypothetical protein